MANSDKTDWFNQGVELAGQGKYESSLIAFETSISLDKTYALPWYGKGNVLYSLGEYEKALVAYETSISLDKTDALPWYGKGTVLYSLREYEKALVAYETSISLDKTDAFPCHGKGNVLDSLGEYEKALAAYETSISLDKTYALPWNGKGNVLFRLGEYEKALVAYETSISLDKTYALPCHGKGNVLDKLGEYEKALAAYETSISLDKTYALPWIGKAQVLKFISGVSGDSERAFNRALFLADGSDLLKLSEFIFKNLYEERQAPFLLFRLVMFQPKLFTTEGLTEAVLDMENVYSIPLACMSKLYCIADDDNRNLKLRTGGCLTYHMGDPIAAEKNWFDALDDDYPKDLLGQYYLILSLYDYWADLAGALKDAVNTANSLQSEDPEQLYYAAQIYLLAGMENEASVALNKAGNYAPALLIRFSKAVKDKDNTAMLVLAEKLLEIEFLSSHQLRFFKYNQEVFFDLTSSEWMIDVLHWAKICELVSEIRLFLTRLDDPQFYELRAHYNDILIGSFCGDMDVVKAWKLNNESSNIIAQLHKKDLKIIELRKDAKLCTNFGEIDKLKNSELAETLFKCVEMASFPIAANGRCIMGHLLVELYYREHRLQFSEAFTLSYYMLDVEIIANPTIFSKACNDAFVTLGGNSAVGLAAISFSNPAILATIIVSSLGSFAFSLLGNWKQKKSIGYEDYKLKLKEKAKKEGWAVPSEFWNSEGF